MYFEVKFRFTEKKYVRDTEKMTFFIPWFMEIESGEIRYRREWIPFVPGAIMENGRLVIHNSMGNFAEAEKDKK